MRNDGNIREANVMRRTGKQRLDMTANDVKVIDHARYCDRTNNDAFLADDPSPYHAAIRLRNHTQHLSC